MNKVIKQGNNCQRHQRDGKPVDGFFSSVQGVRLNVLLVAKREHECCSASGIGRFAGSNYLLAVQISRGEVGFMSSPCSENTWSWSGPRGIFGLGGLNGQGVSSKHSNHLSPRDSHGGKGIVNFYSAFAENNFWCDGEYPNKNTNRESVAESNNGFGQVVSLQEGIKGPSRDQNGDSQVDPAGFTAKNVYVLHNFEITGTFEKRSASSDFPFRKVAA